jgi:hypothetical protein
MNLNVSSLFSGQVSSPNELVKISTSHETPPTFMAVYRPPDDEMLMLTQNEDGSWVWTSERNEAVAFSSAQAAKEAVIDFEAKLRPGYATWYIGTHTRIEEYKDA